MYKRSEVVLVNYPFATAAGVQQKVRPALVVSDHTLLRRFPDDVMLAAVTSPHVAELIPNEVRIEATEPDFPMTGLKTTSVVRLDFIMTVPASMIKRTIGELSPQHMTAVDESLKRSLGLK